MEKLTDPNIHSDLMPNNPQEEEISLLDLVHVIVENLRLLIILPLTAGLFAFCIASAIAPTFTATTRFLPPQQQQSAAVSMLQSLGALGGLAGAATGIKNPNDQIVSLLKSRAVGISLIEKFKLMERYDSTFYQDALKALADNSSISSGKDNLIKIDFEDGDPELAANIANGYVGELEKLLGKLAITEAQQRRVFFERQLALTKDALVKAEESLAASGISTSALNVLPQTALEGPARLRAQVTAQEIRIASMRSYLTDSAPEFRQAVAELSALRAQLTKAEREQPTGRGEANAYISKFREFKYQETLFELFAKQYEIARIDESREGAVIQVVDSAVPPERKSGPKRGFIAMMATLATGFALVLFIFIRQAIRSASQNIDSARKLKDLRQAWTRAIGRRTQP